MINLTTIDGRKITVNCDEIETIETIYDTTISLKSGKKIIVKESRDEIRTLVIEFKQACYEHVLKVGE